MGKYAQIIIGPSGTGKTTYCKIMKDHCDTIKRRVNLVNLDPAIEPSTSSVFSFNIQSLISVPDVMRELHFGPNGALIYCMEYLNKNFDWLREEVQDYDDDYLIFDCPGQIELYTHYKVFQSFIKELTNMGYRICVVYLIDACFITSVNKFIEGNLSCLSAMVNFETTPHINVLTKCDLLKSEKIEKFLEQDIDDILDFIRRNDESINVVKKFQDNEEKFDESDVKKTKNKKKKKENKKMRLNEAICGLLKDFNLVSFVPLNINEPSSIEYVLDKCDYVMQYGEDMEPRTKDYKF